MENEWVLMLAKKALRPTNRQIKLELERAGVEVLVMDPTQLYWCLGEAPFALPERRPLFVWHRLGGSHYDALDLRLAEFFEAQHLDCHNSSQVLARFRDKEAQILFFRSHALPCVPSMAFRGQDFAHLKRELLSRYGEKQSYILKFNRGEGGKGVQCLSDVHVLLASLEAFSLLGDQRLLIQPRLCVQAEYRVFFWWGKIRSVLKRKAASGDFRSNYSQAGSSENLKICDLNHSLRELMQKIMRLSGASYGSLEILEDVQGQYHFLEINCTPGMQQLEQQVPGFMRQSIHLLLKEYRNRPESL